MCLLRVTKKQSNNLLGRGRKSVLLIEHLQIIFYFIALKNY